MRASQPRLQARHSPLPRERGRSWEHPRAPWPSARSEPEETKETILTLIATGQRRGPVRAAGSAASAEVDASGWEGADRAGGAEPGGSRSRIGRALPEIAAGPGRGPESGDGVGVGVGALGLRLRGRRDCVIGNCSACEKRVSRNPENQQEETLATLLRERGVYEL